MRVAANTASRPIVSLNQLRHIIAVNFPLAAFLIGITGHPVSLSNCGFTLSYDVLPILRRHHIVGCANPQSIKTSCPKPEHINNFFHIFLVNIIMS